MQLKGLVRFFTIALILVCLFQLSFTWIVRSFEKEMSEKVDKSMKAKTPEQMYPGDKELQAAYADSLKEAKKDRLQRLLESDSIQDAKIGPFGLTTYNYAKGQELKLGLDLQGGMGVTLEVGIDALIRHLANNTRDSAFNKALEAAILLKANSDADLITLFGNEFKKANPGKELYPYFSYQAKDKIKPNASNDEVLTYLRREAGTAFSNTERIIRTRIDRFGVASPSINPDSLRGIITVELAGMNDEERVKKYLQSTANLQFFEVYSMNDPVVGNAISIADRALADYLQGVKPVDTISKANLDSAALAAAKKADSLNKAKRVENPFTKLLDFNLAQQSRNGSIAFINKKDTALFNEYLSQEVVKNKFPVTLEFMYGKEDKKEQLFKGKLPVYAIKTLENGQAELEGEHVTDARQDFDPKGGVAIKMNMDQEGADIWKRMTEKNINKPIAIVLDKIVHSAPNVNSVIPNGSSEITGNYTVVEAQDLAEILQAGKLSAAPKIVQLRVVGPTLGTQAIQGGGMSFAIAFIVIFALMLLYFNTAGWIANIALILNIFFTVGVLSALGFTLTAPGIAGLVLTIGMAVDTNVIIFERIKEELSRGKSYQLAVADGYKRSYAPVLDSHVTSLLTAIILAYFGLGPVLGFATTQIIGLLLSLFCGIMVSRLISDAYTNKNRHFNYFTKISKKVFAHRDIKFVQYRKVAYMVSGVIFAIGIAALFNGFDEGVEFSGGRSYTITFEKAPNQEQVRDDLKTIFGEYPVIKTVDRPTQLNITTAYKIHETDRNTDSLVEQTLFKGLQKYLPAGITYKDFNTKYKQSSQTVLPTISADLKRGATYATVLAIIVICLYIFIRFRDWRYSLGTIFSLLHDVFVMLAVFSFLRKIVPFPLEIDQHFIAAILTVIGFSMNDTVIVYDRIREDSRLMYGQDKATIINRAINQTLSRTIMTSLTVFLTILILFIFGGEVTRGFAFAMLIGVFTGTYSSIFIAAPMLLEVAKNKPLGKPKKDKM